MSRFSLRRTEEKQERHNYSKDSERTIGIQIGRKKKHKRLVVNSQFQNPQQGAWNLGMSREQSMKWTCHKEYFEQPP